MSMQPEWNFETVKEVKPKTRERSPVNTPPPAQPVSPRANVATPPKPVTDQKAITPKKTETAPVQIEQKSTALYEVIAPILIDLKNQPRYQNCSSALDELRQNLLRLEDLRPGLTDRLLNDLESKLRAPYSVY
jgi:hypothetical protein